MTEALIIAGGYGRRFGALTEDLPKHLLPICGVPMIDILVRQLHHFGITRISIAVGHRGERIEGYFRNYPLPVTVRIIREERPLKSAGALHHVWTGEQTILMMNGDMLTDFDFRNFLEAHRISGADMTIAAHLESHRLTLGEVVQGEGNEVIGYIEKPVKSYRISSGIYAFSPELRLPGKRGTPLSVPELVKALGARHRRIRWYENNSFWIDINEREDLRIAEEALSASAGRFFIDPELIVRPGAG